MSDRFPFMRIYKNMADKLPSKEDQADFYKILVEYALDDVEPTECSCASAVFEAARTVIDNWKAKVAAGKARAEQASSRSSADRQHTTSTPSADLSTADQKDKRIKDKKNKSIKDKKSKREKAEGVLEAYNLICSDLPKARTLTDQRVKHVNARLEEHSLQEMRTVFEKAQKSKFLSGQVKDWRADFDWLINANNFVKVLEGRYDDRDPVKSQYEQDMADILDGVSPEAIAQAESVLI